MNFSLILSLLYMLSQHFYHVECAECSKMLNLKNTESAECKMVGGLEMVTVVCKVGYEFEEDKYVQTFVVGDVRERIECNGIYFQK